MCLWCFPQTQSGPSVAASRRRLRSANFQRHNEDWSAPWDLVEACQVPGAFSVLVGALFDNVYDVATCLSGVAYRMSLVARCASRAGFFRLDPQNAIILDVSPALVFGCNIVVFGRARS